MNLRFLPIIGLIIFGAFSRLIPHLDNLAPITAIALFSGAIFTNRTLAFSLPIAAMLLSDIALSYLKGYPFFHSTLPFVYGTYIIVVCIGFYIRNKLTATPILISTLSSSFLFFLTTNFGVWLLESGVYYSKDTAGLINCYTMAIPFFQNGLIGDLIYSTIFFSAFWLYTKKTSPSKSIQYAPK